MSTTSNFDDLARAWLDEGPTQLSDFTLDAALEEVHLTRQRRAARVPWRFPDMPALTRTTGIAAVALVAVVGAGGLIYLNAKDPGGPGSQATATPTPTAAPSSAPTTAASPRPSEVAPGIHGWTRYTSDLYGFTMAYPSDWQIVEPATKKWPTGDLREELEYAEKFASPGQEEEQIGLLVWEMPSPAGMNVGSDEEDLNLAFATLCQSRTGDPCGVLIPPEKLCLGTLGLLEEVQEGCLPTLIGWIGDEGEEMPHAFVRDPTTGVVTVFWLARPDSFPAYERYGGATELLKAIVSELDVR